MQKISTKNQRQRQRRVEQRRGRSRTTSDQPVVHVLRARAPPRWEEIWVTWIFWNLCQICGCLVVVGSSVLGTLCQVNWFAICFASDRIRISIFPSHSLQTKILISYLITPFPTSGFTVCGKTKETPPMEDTCVRNLRLGEEEAWWVDANAAVPAAAILRSTHHHYYHQWNETIIGKIIRIQAATTTTTKSTLIVLLSWSKAQHLMISSCQYKLPICNSLGKTCIRKPHWSFFFHSFLQPTSPTFNHNSQRLPSDTLLSVRATQFRSKMIKSECFKINGDLKRDVKCVPSADSKKKASAFPELNCNSHP